MKKTVLFIGLLFICGFAKAGWFDDSKIGSDQYTVVYTTAPMGVSASTTVVLVELSSTTWPHPTDGRAIVIDSIQIDNDKAAATTSIVKVGVVREVNSSSGTVVWIERQGQGNNVSNTNVFQKIDYSPGLNCRVNTRAQVYGSNTGTTPYILSNDLLEGSNVLTTGLPLLNPGSTGFSSFLSPGDIVANIVNGAAVANVTITIKYHLETN